MRRLMLLTVIAAAASAAAAEESRVERPYVISHRGCLFECPENTLMAVRWASAAGADVIELDLRVTADNRLVALHDPTVDRTTNGRGPVRRYRLADLKRLDAGRGENIPTAEEVFRVARELRVRLLLDIKDAARTHPSDLVRSIRRHQIADSVVIGTQSLELLSAIENADDRLSTLAFVPEPGETPAYLDAGADVIRWWPRWLNHNQPLMQEIRSRGAQLWVTSGRRRGRSLESVVAHGIDGLITDYPSELLLSLRRDYPGACC